MPHRLRRIAAVAAAVGLLGPAMDPAVAFAARVAPRAAGVRPALAAVSPVRMAAVPAMAMSRSGAAPLASLPAQPAAARSEPAAPGAPAAAVAPAAAGRADAPQAPPAPEGSALASLAGTDGAVREAVAQGDELGQAGALATLFEGNAGAVEPMAVLEAQIASFPSPGPAPRDPGLLGRVKASLRALSLARLDRKLAAARKAVAAQQAYVERLRESERKLAETAPKLRPGPLPEPVRSQAKELLNSRSGFLMQDALSAFYQGQAGNRAAAVRRLKALQARAEAMQRVVEQLDGPALPPVALELLASELKVLKKDLESAIPAAQARFEQLGRGAAALETKRETRALGLPLGRKALAKAAEERVETERIAARISALVGEIERLTKDGEKAALDLASASSELERVRETMSRLKKSRRSKQIIEDAAELLERRRRAVDADFAEFMKSWKSIVDIPYFDGVPLYQNDEKARARYVEELKSLALLIEELRDGRLSEPVVEGALGQLRELRDGLERDVTRLGTESASYAERRAAAESERDALRRDNDERLLLADFAGQRAEAAAALEEAGRVIAASRKAMSWPRKSWRARLATRFRNAGVDIHSEAGRARMGVVDSVLGAAYAAAELITYPFRARRLARAYAPALAAPADTLALPAPELDPSAGALDPLASRTPTR